MPWTAVCGLRGQLFGKPKAIAGKIIRRAVQPLLQSAAGIDRLADGFGVACERRLALQLEVGRQRPQAAHLVADLAGRGFSRPAQALIERMHPVEQRDQLSVQRQLRRRQISFPRFWNRAGSQQLPERGRVFGKDLFQREVVLAQQVPNGYCRNQSEATGA